MQNVYDFRMEIVIGFVYSSQIQQKTRESLCVVLSAPSFLLENLVYEREKKNVSNFSFLCNSTLEIPLQVLCQIVLFLRFSAPKER